MKRVGSLKSVFKAGSKQSDNNNDQPRNEKDEMSILGNLSQNQIQKYNKESSGSNSLIPKGLSNFFNKNGPLKGTLTRNKNKDKFPVSRKNYKIQGLTI